MGYHWNKQQVEKVIQAYDPDHDLGPDCPVTWREERLASLLLDLAGKVEELEIRVATLENPGTPGRDR